MTTEIKTIPENAREFTANGRRFIVHDKLTVDGYQRMEEFRLEIETGTSAGAAVKTIGQVVNALKKNDVFTASVHAYNATAALERISEKVPHPLLLTLTLFVRPEGSDLSEWNEAEAISWLQDFNAEGYSVTDLFILADSCRSAFVSNFLRSSPDIFPQESDPSENETTQEPA